MADDKKPGLFAKLFGKGDHEKKNSCCCCGDFEIEAIEGPERKNKEDKKEEPKTP